jgi:hypothetical protein
MASTSKGGGNPAPVRKKKDAPITDETDWENHWLLRVPETFADRLRAFCAHHPPGERLRIKFNQDQRSGTLHVGQDTLHFTAYDLPCIVEVMALSFVHY